MDPKDLDDRATQAGSYEALPPLWISVKQGNP